MAVPISIPRLGWNMDEGVFAGWLKQDGEKVRTGDSLFSLEWEKATQEIEAIDEGILSIGHHAPSVGDRVAVGAVIGHLLQPGETELVDSATEPRAGHRATATAPPGQRAANTAAPPQPGQSRRGGRRISPLARRLANELGVDWSKLAGSGCTGRIRKADILAAVSARGQSHAAAPASSGDSTSAGRIVPITSIRQTIAARLLKSLRTTAPVTLTTTADATNLVNLRDQFKTVQGGRDVPTYLDFLVKLTACALQDHPLLGARWHGDQIEVFDHVHIGIAVDTESGLLVPVIREVQTLGLAQIAARSEDLIRRAQQGRLQPGEMHGGTFTITNLGAFGIETFTPIINYPQCAVLGVGRIQRQPVAQGDQLTTRDRISLSLTFDHRIVDGGPAARFVQSLVQLIENPSPRLIP
jgi:pyruvate dehydrogenase E2 component (dihydrolipoamide acetyltransferase)